MEITSPATGRTIPQAYIGIAGVLRGANPTPIQQGRYVIRGAPGIGKTSFAASNPHALVIDLERGAGTVANPKALIYTPPTTLATPAAQMEAIDRILSVAITEAQKAKGVQAKLEAIPIQHIVFDSFDEWIAYGCRFFANKGGVDDIGEYGKGHGIGYRLVRNNMENWLQQITQAGLGWTMLAHQRTVSDEDNKQKSRVELVASESFAEWITRISEHMFTIEPGTTVTFPSKGKPGVKGNGPAVVQRGRFLKTATVGESTVTGGRQSTAKARLPFAESVFLPPVGGWEEAFAPEYAAAVSRRLKLEA